MRTVDSRAVAIKSMDAVILGFSLHAHRRIPCAKVADVSTMESVTLCNPYNANPSSPLGVEY